MYGCSFPLAWVTVGWHYTSLFQLEVSSPSLCQSWSDSTWWNATMHFVESVHFLMTRWIKSWCFNRLEWVDEEEQGRHSTFPLDNSSRCFMSAILPLWCEFWNSGCINLWNRSWETCLFWSSDNISFWNWIFQGANFKTCFRVTCLKDK